jgi:hypothetical protein
VQDKNLRNIFLLFLIVASGLFTMPARASFGDCNSSAYLGQFDERLASESGFLCVETGRTPVTSEAGTTHIRIIQHLVSDWARRPGAMRSFKQGVDASATAMSSLGGFRISDVTILLVDGFAPGSGRVKEDFGEIAAWTNFAPGGECRITIWLLGSGATASYGAAVVSHELFHCVQRSSLSLGQLTSAASLGRSGGGTWWQEGSADWFSTLAVPPPRYMSDRVQAFDNKSPRTALNIMTYDAYVFFAWLGGARGPRSVMPFLHSMATSSSEAAQRAAMVAALPAEQWLRFAEDYMDQRIRDGHGGSIGSTPQTGDTYEWENTRTQRVDLAPFIIRRANITFRCGRWRVEPRPQKFHAVKAGGSETWGNFPTTIDAMDGTPRQFRFVAMNASAASVALQIVGTLETSCRECAAIREIDRCVIGTWQMTQDGMQQWAREHLRNFRVTEASLENNTLTLNEDRSFITGESHVSAKGEAVISDSRATGSAQLAGRVSGRWSAASGNFNMCPDAGAAVGSVTTVVHGRSITTPMNTGPLRPSVSTYVCSGNSLRVTMQVGTIGPVTSVYTRVAGPR